MSDDPQLSRLDVHEVRTPAEPDRVWEAIPRTVAAPLRSLWARRLASLLGCREWSASRAFAAVEGATVPGFRVARARPPRELVLEGRHRFARYRLTFEIEPEGEGSRLRAVTDAEFPGLQGACYRAAVVTTGGHRIATRRLLTSIARRAERGRSHREEER